MTSVATEDRGGARMSRPGVAEPVEDAVGLVVGVLDDIEFALPVDHVERILPAPATMTPIPGGDPHILGMIDFRDGVLPVLCPRALLGLPRRTLPSDGRVVALSAGAGAVGLAMDAVHEVCQVPVASLVPAAGDGTGAVEAVCRLDGGRRLLSVLSVTRLLSAGGVPVSTAPPVPESSAAPVPESPAPPVPESSAAPVPESSAAPAPGDGAGRGGGPPADQGTEAEEDECVLVFRVDHEEYALPVDHVLEISRVPPAITRVPRAGPSIRGIVNLRGTALPLVDLRIRLGLAPIPPDAGQRVVVLDVDGTRAGLLVDGVTEVTSYAPHALRPTPAVSPDLARLCPRVALLPGSRTVLLMRAERLVAGPPSAGTIGARAGAGDRTGPVAGEDGPP